MNGSIEAAQSLVARYLAAWNETDAARRRALIAATWTEDAHYVDPVAQSTAHDGIDAMIAAVQARFPGMRFTPAGTLDAHHDCIRFAWSLAPEGSEPVVQGTDFAVVRDGRLRAVTGFFDKLPPMG